MKKSAFAFGLLALGCQPKTKTVEVEKPEKVYTFTKQTQDTPVAVPLYDAACNSQRGLKLSNGVIHAAYGRIEAVSTTTTIEESDDLVRQTFENDVVNEGREIWLCRDTSLIPDHTQEGAAIGMKAAADAAFNLYQRTRLGANFSLPTLGPVDLQAAVNVKFIERTVDVKGKAQETTTALVDNAVFMPAEDGGIPSLASYPQSVTSQKLGLLGGVPLWTIPGVFQHEYGHFIFSSILNEGDRSFASYQDFAKHNPDIHMFHENAAQHAKFSKNKAFANFALSQDYFLGSLNEGFADLWSYYTLKQPQTLFEISCFTKNRNVASPVLFDGLGKTWNEDLWYRVFTMDADAAPNTKGKAPTEICALPYFGDIHIVGAVIAHTVDAVFTEAAKVNTLRDASELKAEMALAWLKALKASDEFEDLGGKASLSRMLNTAIGTAIPYLKGSDKTALCAVVNSKFPVLVKRWKNARTDNEDVAGVVSFCSL